MKDELVVKDDIQDLVLGSERPGLLINLTLLLLGAVCLLWVAACK